MIYEGQIQYQELDDNKNWKVVKEKYIILDVKKFADAENKLWKELYGRVQYDVTALKRSSLKEIVNTRTSEDERIFIADVKDVLTSDDGSVTENIYKIALFAKNMDAAYSKIDEYLKQGYDMELVGLKATKFVDVI